MEPIDSIITIAIILGIYIIIRLVVYKISVRPINLGWKEDGFQACPSTPNCVSTTASSDDEEHHIEPIQYSCDFKEAYNRVLEIITEYGRARLVLTKERYVYAEFKSLLWRFTDDVEFYFPEDDNIIHFRSASRIGSRDNGENRKRMERLRKAFHAKDPQLME